jgi:hypothetical protein
MSDVENRVAALLGAISRQPTLPDVDDLLRICTAHRGTYGNLIDRCLEIRWQLTGANSEAGQGS